MLNTDYQKYIHQSRYARWCEAEGRRETYEETVDRYFHFMGGHLLKHHDYTIPPKLLSELRQAVLDQEVMPSMRALMTSGPALERDNVAGFNCAYLPMENPRCFDELFYILMCGTGVGYSVENKYVGKLPEINEHFETSESVIHVNDSKAGWARAYRELLSMLWAGQVPTWDVSKVRPAGAILKTFGGRASGPGPLVELFRYTAGAFKKASGRRLTSLEVHDINCKIASVVVVGGVRRSAMISLSDLEDSEMRECKSGNWWVTHPDRAYANNSAVYNSKPSMGVFFNEWKHLYESRSGERGIFSREASIKQALMNGRRDSSDFGTNPCSEIILRPYQFCNLTEVVVREGDKEDDLGRKIRVASILGTFQSTFTHFKYLRKIWTQNTEEERLLGVSLTGIFDNEKTSLKSGLEFDKQNLRVYKDLTVETNKVYAKKLGINQSVATTCVKPSGTVSQLVNSASGIHPRYSQYYIRRVLGDNKDPITKFMKDSGIPNEPHNNIATDTTVFMFPIKSPGNFTRKNLGPYQHLELWKTYQELWCEHKPSITVDVPEDQWMGVGAWVYENFDYLSGVSFLPEDTGTYQQAPYEEISEEQYDELLTKMPKSDIDWRELGNYETEDRTTSSQELACAGNVCEVL